MIGLVQEYFALECISPQSEQGRDFYKDIAISVSLRLGESILVLAEMVTKDIKGNSETLDKIITKVAEDDTLYTLFVRGTSTFFDGLSLRLSEAIEIGSYELNEILTANEIFGAIIKKRELLKRDTTVLPETDF